MTQHAELGASRTERWMNCPGSVRLSRQVPDVDTVYAAEGREAHALAETMFQGRNRGAEHSEEMWHAVGMYADFVDTLREGRELRVEVKFDLSPLRPPQPMFGTADAVITGNRRLDVVDLKYGQGVVVEAAGNTQLLYYVVGALVDSVQNFMSVWQLPMVPWQVVDVALSAFDELWVHIVQPRASHPAGPIRSWQVSHDEIREYVKLLLERAEATLDPNAPLHAGSWCKFCPAQAFCPEVKRYAIEVAQRDFTVVEPPPVETLPIEVIGSILSKVDVLEHWVASLRQRAQAELEAGRTVPGWKLVAKRPRRVWNSTEELQKWAAEAGLKDEVFQEPELKSPAQIEEVIGKKNLPEALYSLVSTGHVLAPEYDRRPGLTLGPREEFTALPTPKSEE